MTLALSLNTSILGLPPLAWWAILVIVSFVAFFAVALCKAAADGDAQMTRARREREEALQEPVSGIRLYVDGMNEPIDRRHW